MQIAVIIPAAGLGKRFSSGQLPGGRTKIEQDLEGRPIFQRSLELFYNRPEVKQIILAVNPEALSEFKFRWADKLGFHGVKLVAGGTRERWETVLKALDHVGKDCTHVAVHDAARPLASKTLIDRVFEAARHYSAVIPATPIAATLKKVAAVPPREPRQRDPMAEILGDVVDPHTPALRVVKTVAREHLAEAQTPQVFELEVLRQAYAQITNNKVATAGITDDAGLIEASGRVVYVVDGEPTNLKITRAADMELASMIVRTREQKEAADIGRKRLFAHEEDE